MAVSNATILVVSGPEITDMYVGESERKVRELFGEARRNAPAVLVFDEFDSIAAQRSKPLWPAEQSAASALNGRLEGPCKLVVRPRRSFISLSLRRNGCGLIANVSAAARSQ